MRRISIFLAFSIMCVVGMQVSAANIIMDFSELNRADNNETQQGWNVSGIMDEIGMAKYLVIETEGEGNNGDGFNGIQLILQGNDDDPANIEVGWTELPLNGEWLSFSRAEEKTISIAIDLKNVMGGKYNDFLQCTNWARILLGYYGGTSAFEGLALKNVYLTYDFDKPSGAVDLNENYGFVFEGSVGVAEPKEKENLPMGRNSDLSAGWESSYSADTKTITFNADETGRGWWFGSRNFSDYTQVVIKFEPVEFNVQLIVEYADGTTASTTAMVEPGATKVIVDLDGTAKSVVQQIYLQAIGADGGGTLTLSEAYLTSTEETSISNVLSSSNIAYYAGNTLFLNDFGSVQVYDINGRIQLTKQNVFSVDLSALSNGVYIAKAIANGQTQVVKIVK